MITVSDIEGHTIKIAPAAIATITESAVSAVWHGIRAYIKLFDGKTIECRETPREIEKMLDRENERGR